MAYLRKHRRQFAGIASPIFFLFILGAISFSVFPGWLRPSFGTPGAPCSVNVFAGTGVGFSSDCDICNGEVCFDVNSNSTFICVAAIRDTGSGSFSTDPSLQNPQCPNGALLEPLSSTPFSFGQSFYPVCWDQCTPFSTVVATFGTQPILLPLCQPSDGFCDGISGGNQANDCRSAECTAISTPDPINPSGCDYDLVPASQNDECRLCGDVEAAIPACGNGVCEGAENEDCQTCPVDCLLPGFEDSCPLTSGTAIQDSCTPPIPGISFDGPPYNVQGSQGCEDGDVCTVNQCSADNSTCEVVSDGDCSGNTQDFCCPSSCNPPPDGAGTCNQALDPNCDSDCYQVQDCTPTPTPNNLEIFGQGCALQTGAAGSGLNQAWPAYLAMVLVLGSMAALRRKA